MRSSVGQVPGKEGGVEERKRCLGPGCSCGPLPASSLAGSRPPVLSPLVILGKGPGPPPGHLPPGLQRSRVTQEGGGAAWKRLSILFHNLPGRQPEFPTFSVGPGWPASSSVLQSTWDLNPASTQEKPGLSQGVASWPWPGARCQPSGRRSGPAHVP